MGSSMIIGFFLIVLVGILQGGFMFPSKFIKEWKWEHYWMVYSVFGLVVINLLIGIFIIPDVFSIIAANQKSVMIIVLLGLLWGGGSIMFGKGMEMLGMALGYPIIMGLASTFGALFPALVFSPEIFLETKGFILLSGMLLAIVGIVLCSKATGIKDNDNNQKKSIAGIFVAIGAGLLSTMPNIAIVVGGDLIEATAATLPDPSQASNILWMILFPAGFIVNSIYIISILKKNNNSNLFFKKGMSKNWILSISMATMWIVSLYLYGYGADKMGELGLVIGWPVFVSLSIIFGNFLGIFSGEWKGASKKAKSILNVGIAVLVISVIVISLSN